MIYSFSNLFPLLRTCPPFNLILIQFLLGFLHTFFKSILSNLSTFSFLKNRSPISTLSLNLQSPSLRPIERVSSSLPWHHPLFLCFVVSSHLSATNLVKSLASYSDTFVLTLLLQLSLDSTFPLSAQFWNTAVSSGTLLLLLFLIPSILFNFSHKK